MVAMKAMKAKAMKAGSAMTASGAYGSVAKKLGLKSRDVKAVMEGIDAVAAQELKKNGKFKIAGAFNLKLKKKPAKAARVMTPEEIERIKASKAKSAAAKAAKGTQQKGKQKQQQKGGGGGKGGKSRIPRARCSARGWSSKRWTAPAPIPASLPVRGHSRFRKENQRRRRCATRRQRTA